MSNTQSKPFHRESSLYLPQTADPATYGRSNAGGQLRRRWLHETAVEVQRRKAAMMRACLPDRRAGEAWLLSGALSHASQADAAGAPAAMVLDGEGRVVRHTERLAVDPFAVDATIAHFELCYARCLAVESNSPLAPVVAYWRALRELTRQELDEVVRRSRTDELRVLEGGGDGGVTDEEFERWFFGFVGKNLVAGGAMGAALYFAAKGVALML